MTATFVTELRNTNRDDYLHSLTLFGAEPSVEIPGQSGVWRLASGVFLRYELRKAEINAAVAAGSSR